MLTSGGVGLQRAGQLVEDRATDEEGGDSRCVGKDLRPWPLWFRWDAGVSHVGAFRSDAQTIMGNRPSCQWASAHNRRYDARPLPKSNEVIGEIGASVTLRLAAARTRRSVLRLAINEG